MPPALSLLSLHLTCTLSHGDDENLNIFSKTPGVSLCRVFTRARKSLKVFARGKSVKVLSFPTDEAADGV